MTSPSWSALITVPEAHRPSFAKLGNLPPANFEGLVSRLSKLDVRSSMKDLTATLSEFGVIDPLEVTQALIGFSQFRLANGVSAEQGAQAIGANLGEDAGPRDLTPLLASEGLVAAAKVIDLTNAFPQRLFNGRVITDLRPVFDEAAEAITGMIVVHQLTLEVWDGGDTKELFVTLDDRDLDTLAEQIDRARKKSETLNTLAAQKSIVLFTNKEGENNE